SKLPPPPERPEDGFCVGGGGGGGGGVTARIVTMADCESLAGFVSLIAPVRITMGIVPAPCTPKKAAIWRGPPAAMVVALATRRLRRPVAVVGTLRDAGLRDPRRIEVELDERSERRTTRADRDAERDALAVGHDECILGELNCDVGPFVDGDRGVRVVVDV